MTPTLRTTALIGLGGAGLVLVAPVAASAAAPTPTAPARIATAVPGPPGQVAISVAPLPTTPPTAVPGGGALQVPAGRVELHHGTALWPTGLLAAGGAVLLAGAGVVVRRR